MSEILSFFIILSAGLVFSEIFKRLDLPYVSALIVGGILIGPYFLNIIEVDAQISFLGSIGVIFLMFMAGSEIKMDSFKSMGRDILILTVFNGIIPFITGFLIGQAFGYGFLTSMVLSTALISSSIAVIIPAMESHRLIDTNLGKTVITATVLEDIASLILLAILLQNIHQTTSLPIILHMPAVILLIIGMKVVIPMLEKKFHKRKRGRDLFESELRFVFSILLASVIIFESIGVHSIVAGFIIGILLGDSVTGKVENKIKTISYGLFIPTFFIIIGMNTDISVLFSTQYIILAAAVVLGSIGSKIMSGYIAGKLIKKSNKESLLIGVLTTPQLSTTLAIAFAAVEFQILTQEIITSLVMLSITTTLISPLLIKAIVSRRDVKVTKL